MSKSEKAKARRPATQTLVAANQANARFDFMFAATMIGIGALMVWYFELPLNFNVMSPDFNPVTIAATIFAVIGLYSLVRAVLLTYRLRKFGTSSIETYAVRPGGYFAGRLSSTRAFTATGDFHASVKCIQRVGVLDDPSSAIKTYRSVRDKVVWQTTVTAEGRTIGPDRQIEIAFNLPADGPASRGAPIAGGMVGGVRWVLEITAPTPGLNYYAIFAIPVLGS